MNVIIEVKGLKTKLLDMKRYWLIVHYFGGHTETLEFTNHNEWRNKYFELIGNR